MCDFGTIQYQPVQRRIIGYSAVPQDIVLIGIAHLYTVYPQRIYIPPYGTQCNGTVQRYLIAFGVVFVVVFARSCTIPPAEGFAFGCRECAFGNGKGLILGSLYDLYVIILIGIPGIQGYTVEAVPAFGAVVIVIKGVEAVPVT